MTHPIMLSNWDGNPHFKQISAKMQHIGEEKLGCGVELNICKLVNKVFSIH
jgi:hypothetical protein